MTTLSEEAIDAPWRPGVPEVALLAVIAVGITAMYLVGQVWPVWHNGFLAQPYDSWSLGQQDPKDIWPVNQPVDAVVTTAGTLCALLLVPAVPMIAGLGAAIVGVNVARQGRRGLATVMAVAFGLCVALTAFHFSPLGLAINSWRMD